MTIDSAGKTALVETSAYLDRNSQTADFIERVRVNQQRLTAELKPILTSSFADQGDSFCQPVVIREPTYAVAE